MALKVYLNEEWKAVDMGYPSQKKYVISNHGRFVSYTDKIEDGKHIVGSDLKGYKIYQYSYIDGGKKISKHFLMHRMVALHFLPPPREDQKYIIHLNYSKSYNHVSNLRWATSMESYNHTNKNPDNVDFFAKKNSSEFKGSKMNAEKARMIKKKILDPNRKTRYKTLAKQFGVSEMAIYRMKRGENWGEISVD